jgi:hypothetical protein
MSQSGKTGVDRSLILSILVFFCVGICIYKAKEFANSVSSERTTTAQVVSVYHSIFRGLRFNYYSCSYNFSVDGVFYVGLSDCPQRIADDAAKGMYSGSAGELARTNVTVYYNSVDPSVNSLLEFSAASEIEYRVAIPWICLGSFIILVFVLLRLLSANEKRGKGGVFVDAGGTVIYPGEIGIRSEFAGLPNSESANYFPSHRLREQYLQVANTIHPDRAMNEDDLALRERLMKEANAAFERGDADTLRRVLAEYKGAIPGGGQV